MKRILAFVLLLASFTVSAQTAEISENYVAEVMRFLTSDALKGRKNYSPELLTAAKFIAGEYRKNDLLFFGSDTSYLQPFTTTRKKGFVKQADGYFDPSKVLYNVIAYLPADTVTEETVIFSAHYDHLGAAGKKRIFNGANDNASGTAAVIALAKYYAATPGRKRNILFCAFAGEELGLHGSAVFVERINPAAIIAGVNIEMIGVPGKHGRHSFFITGAEYSTLEKLVKKSLEGTQVKVVKEPDAAKQLFFRSDNYSFARKGIPAHSFMSSDDDDACYHAACDDFTRIDIAHLTTILRSITAGVHSLIYGTETPARVNTSRIAGDVF